jgi:hypothetical protein
MFRVIQNEHAVAVNLVQDYEAAGRRLFVFHHQMAFPKKFLETALIGEVEPFIGFFEDQRKMFRRKTGTDAERLPLIQEEERLHDAT